MSLAGAFAAAAFVAGAVLVAPPGAEAANGGTTTVPEAARVERATAAVPTGAAVGTTQVQVQVQVQVPDRREVRAQCRAAGLARECAAAGVR